MLVNLAPHPIRVYATDTPNVIDPAEHEPLLELLPAGDRPARVGEIDLGRHTMPGCPVPVSFIEYRNSTGLPPYYTPLPRGDRVWYVVSLLLAIAMQGIRNDLLAPYREVRNAEGVVVGCRELVLPT